MSGAWPVRNGERGLKERTGPEPGIVLTHPDGTKFWFPGETITHSRILMESAVPSGVLDDPATRIEFGTKIGARFVSGAVIKGGTRGPDTK
jgi:hypothetical protein